MPWNRSSYIHCLLGRDMENALPACPSLAHFCHYCMGIIYPSRPTISWPIQISSSPFPGRINTAISCHHPTPNKPRRKRINTNDSGKGIDGSTSTAEPNTTIMILLFNVITPIFAHKSGVTTALCNIQTSRSGSHSTRRSIDMSA
mmetsp:Transcript_37998/g.61016  ORF Transcript_37998/g.61016 Transcript_37998/m.61016 type:complete len:145 (+) Transcript_37998:238-672(+)